MSAESNPIDDPDAWDVFILAGQGSPGIAEVTGASAPRKLDKKDGHGQSGATVSYTGDELAEFTVTIRLLETADWDAWWIWRQLLAKPPKGAKPSAYSCSHPALAPLGIDSCLVKEEGQPEPNGDTGEWKIPIKFVQYRKPTPALGTPQGATVTAAKDPPPQTAFEKTAAELTQHVLDLARPPGPTNVSSGTF